MFAHEDQTARNSPNSPFLPSELNRPHLDMQLYAPGGDRRLVRVANHRGDWRNFVENTLEAIESSIEMGADIVEIDVWTTKDGHLILMHDDTLDRTTDGEGKICDHTLEEIRALHLKDGLGNMTEYTVPTLEEALLLAKDRIIVNLDKSDLYLDQVYELLVKTGMVHQTIVKSEMPFPKFRAKWGDLVDKVVFMPVLTITPKTTLDDIVEAFKPRHDLYELVFETDEREQLELIKRLAAQTQATLWINTIWPTTCAGHSDDHALKNMDDTWGFVVDVYGGGILQTDRPALMLKYLKKRGWHVE